VAVVSCVSDHDNFGRLIRNDITTGEGPRLPIACRASMSVSAASLCHQHTLTTDTTRGQHMGRACVSCVPTLSAAFMGANSPHPTLRERR
jgi:hypothetical protein